MLGSTFFLRGSINFFKFEWSFFFEFGMTRARGTHDGMIDRFVILTTI